MEACIKKEPDHGTCQLSRLKLLCDIVLINKEKLENDPVQKQTASYAISHYGSQLSKMAEIGYDAIPDFILSIGYINGSLRDLGQSKGYGTGDTEWLETLKRQTGVNY
ncbi:DUF4885 family protein [Bacillus mojavensis]|uniref:DUF4885 family protein n=1 Tax=Bacillus mojavensis TaxID=72360 RepID=UPI00398A8F6F